MKFSKKIFISVFLTTIALGGFLIWVAYSYVNEQNHQQFLSRYSAFADTLGDTLTRLDTNTEMLMNNAAQVVVAKHAEKGLLATEELTKLKDNLGVTHLFVINKGGTFIRSTNEDPSLIPNLFGFCEEYKLLVTGEKAVHATPVLKPEPEPRPYKFLSMPTRDLKYIVEVGVRVDFIAGTLAEALANDSNVESMSLFAPDGTSFGQFRSDGVKFVEEKAAVPKSGRGIVESDTYARFFTKVRSSHPRCCQCEKSGTSKGGEYYYVLESKISKAELKAVQATTRNSFIILFLLNGLLALLLSRLLSRKLVKNIERSAKRVQEIKESGNFQGRIGLQGKDEVSYLTREFDNLLDKLEDSTKRIVEAERVKARVDVARETAHNIKSPVRAIEMLLPTMISVPEGTMKVVRSSIKEIKTFSKKLGSIAESFVSLSEAPEERDVHPLIVDLIDSKRAEYRRMQQIAVTLTSAGKPFPLPVIPHEFRSALSNIINNSVEAIDENGTVEVAINYGAEGAQITIEDSGSGIDPRALHSFENEQPFSTKLKGMGVGLVHARKLLREWGWTISIEKLTPKGTRVTLLYQTARSHVLVPLRNDGTDADKEVRA